MNLQNMLLIFFINYLIVSLHSVFLVRCIGKLEYLVFKMNSSYKLRKKNATFSSMIVLQESRKGQAVRRP